MTLTLWATQLWLICSNVSHFPLIFLLHQPGLFISSAFPPCCVRHGATSLLTGPPTSSCCFCFLRAFSQWSIRPDSGPLEVQLSGEPPDGRVRGSAESHPSPSALSSTAAAHGQGTGMQPELPYCYRQVLRRTLWRRYDSSLSKVLDKMLKNGTARTETHKLVHFEKCSFF